MVPLWTRVAIDHPNPGVPEGRRSSGRFWVVNWAALACGCLPARLGRLRQVEGRAADACAGDGVCGGDNGFMDWTIVIPIKHLSDAKSRLCSDPVLRSALAEAFGRDTITAVAGSVGGERTVVVTPDPRIREIAEGLGARTSTTGPAGPLNEALVHVIRELDPQSPAGVLAADLPCATPEAIRTMLARAGQHPKTFLPDASGSGTVALLAWRAEDLAPAFGANSASEHASAGFTQIHGPGLARLQRDVDTGEDLRLAWELGVGKATMKLMCRTEVTVLTFDGERGSAALDDGHLVHFTFETIADLGFRHVRPGQRLRLLRARRTASAPSP